jgi:hypothetical protein
MEAEVQVDSASDDLKREAGASLGRPVSGLGDEHQVRLIADPRST